MAEIEHQLNTRSVTELKDLCRHFGVTGYSKLKKEEIIRKLMVSVDDGLLSAKVHELMNNNSVQYVPVDSEDSEVIGADDFSQKTEKRHLVLNIYRPLAKWYREYSGRDDDLLVYTILGFFTSYLPVALMMGLAMLMTNKMTDEGWVWLILFYPAGIFVFYSDAWSFETYSSDLLFNILVPLLAVILVVSLGFGFWLGFEENKEQKKRLKYAILKALQTYDRISFKKLAGLTGYNQRDIEKMFLQSDISGVKVEKRSLVVNKNEIEDSQLLEEIDLLVANFNSAKE